MLHHEAVKTHGSVAAAARAFKLSRTTFRERLEAETRRSAITSDFVAGLSGNVASATEDVADLIRRRAAHSDRMAKRRATETWLPICVPEHGPFGVVWFGDPHLDDDHCDWGTLLEHVEICRTTDGLYGASVGDATNNWVGRLMRLYGDQSATKSEARQLAKWFMRDCGVNWLLWLIGNHDEWNEGEAILGLISNGATYLPSWESRLEFRACGQSWRVHAAHDFKGSSIWNPTHGPLRKGMMTGGLAELYVCGHRHTFAQQTVEIEERGTIVHAVRARGYKRHDHHAVVNGFPQGKSGAAVLTIFNPQASSPAGRIMTFADVATGAAVLSVLRHRAGLGNVRKVSTAKARKNVDRSKRPARGRKKSSR